MSPRNETIVVIVTSDDNRDLSTSWSANEAGDGVFAGPLRVQAAQAAADHAVVEIFEGELWTADAASAAGAYAAIASAAGAYEFQLDRGPGHLIAKILGADTIGAF